MTIKDFFSFRQNRFFWANILDVYKRQVQADVQSRIFFQHLDGFWIPGCYGHHFHAAGNNRAVGLDAGFVDGMPGTEIVNADDKCRGCLLYTSS